MANKTSCLSSGVLKHIKSQFTRVISSGALTLGLSLSTVLFAQTCQPALAEVVRDDQPKAHGESNLPDIPISVWREESSKPKAVAVCVHGLVMHGRVYDRMARTLASQGFVVYAQDLRGYGRWQEKSYQAVIGDERPAGPHTQSITLAEPTAVAADGSKVAEVRYDKSFEDLKMVIEAAHREHPSLPLFLIGESLGAGLSLHAAQDMPGCVNGLVLSSPALKRRLYIAPTVVKDCATLVTNPHQECDLAPYIKKLSSEDPRIVQEELSDPYIRKHLTCKDVLNTFSMIKSNLSYARNVSADIPVLVIQGDRDRILKQNAVVLLLDRLKCKDQTVRWLPGKGHVLIETGLIEPSTLNTIASWLNDHVPEENLVQAQNSMAPDSSESD
ncbi:MAG: alpha/beta fold hydrolase [Cyanobacteria bacterium SZAS LIN-3]|nr:alpha/beta fold hydrolase [Cyanobacteria bacterium SZAS LIN-3]